MRLDSIAFLVALKPGASGNQRGGLGKAHQLFGEQLPTILDELNLKLVA